LKQTIEGYKVVKSKLTMEKPDLFHINGVYCDLDNGEVLVAG